MSVHHRLCGNVLMLSNMQLLKISMLKKMLWWIHDDQIHSEFTLSVPWIVILDNKGYN